jgi:hypothetical protein
VKSKPNDHEKSRKEGRVRLLPRSLDNTYRGSHIAVGFFILLTAVTVVRSLIHIVAPDGGAQSIATIPLDSFTTNGSAALVHLFALWGLSQLIIGIVYVVALLRYKSFLPLLYLLAIVEYAVRLALTVAKPFEVSGTAPGGVGNYMMVPVLILMFVLSLMRRRRRPVL